MCLRSKIICQNISKEKKHHSNSDYLNLYSQIYLVSTLFYTGSGDNLPDSQLFYNRLNTCLQSQQVFKTK